MAKVRLGKEEIDGLTCPAGRKDVMVFDAELPGFAVRITKAGAKVFFLQYRRGDRIQRMRLGEYGTITPAQARKMATIARGKVLGGEDVVTARKNTIAAEDQAIRQARVKAKADAFTFDKLITAWATQHLIHRRPTYRTETQRALRRNLAELLATPAHSLDATDIRRVLALIPAKASDDAETPKKRGKNAPGQPTTETMARRVRAYGFACYNWAMAQDLVKANPFTTVKPAGREVARDRVLSDAELGEVWRASGTLGWPWAPFIRVLLLTLQREAEVAGMLWAEISAGGALWEMPGTRTKNRKPHLVHMAKPVREILNAVPRVPLIDDNRLPGRRPKPAEGAEVSPFVFTTTGRTGISGFSRAKVAIDKAIREERAKLAEQAGDDSQPAPLVPWRFHDFRRTGVTIVARKGVRWEVADRVLNHVGGAISGVAAVYQRHEFFEEREAAMTLWAEHLLMVGADDIEKAASAQSATDSASVEGADG